MILTDHQIRDLGKRGVIAPYAHDQVGPSSYDVRLGNDFRVFQRDATPFIDLDDPEDITRPVSIADEDYFLLHPGEFVLGVTRERVEIPDHLVATVEGKSSIGRLGLVVHVTAGYIDPGFHGPITLEMACFHPLPIALRPGKLIAQLSFHEMSAVPEHPYRGRYQNATSVEASKYGRPHPHP